MSKIICSTSIRSLGCKFLDWSINFLSGRCDYLHKDHGIIGLPADPLTDKNAHNHNANHPMGFKETKEFVEFLESQGNYFSLYPGPIGPLDILKKLGININNLTADNLQLVNNQTQQDYQQLLEYLHSKHVKIIFLTSKTQIPLYFTKSRSDSMPFSEKGTRGTQDQIQKKFDELFFKHNTNWTIDSQDKIWDLRERRALDFRPFDRPDFDVQLPAQSLAVDAQDLWYNGHDKIKEIINYCQLYIDQSRLSQWNNVYSRWQKIQMDTLEFQNSYQDILTAIVNGDFLEIDLSFDQEVIIQHCLIYQHNLNLKNWMLEKFPGNTRDLHKLLEQNIHPVQDIYNCMISNEIN